MKSAKLLLCSVALLPAVCAHAASEKEDLLKLKVSADYGNSDNATRAPEEEPQFSERQGLYTALAGLSYNSEWSNLSSNYRLQRETFERNSQPNLTELEGRTQLILGNEFHPLGLSVTHDRRAMLNAPDAIDLTSNRDTREIISISPSAKTRVGDADTLMLAGTYADISYKEDELRQSNQKSGQFAWIHGISRTDQIQLVAQHLETSFEHAPQVDYTLQTASAEYSVELKRLKYSLRAGYNKAIRSSDDDFSSPAYSVESSYDSGLNIFSLSLSQTITDSSSMGGAGSFDNFNSLGANSSAKGVGLDLINLRNTSIAWSTEAMCERCSFGLNASQMKQDYQNLKEDGNEYSLYAHFAYQLSRASSVKLSAGHRERKFSDTNASRSGFDSDIARISFDHDLTKGLQLEVYVQQEKRTSKTGLQNYKENIAGLKISYDFQ